MWHRPHQDPIESVFYPRGNRTRSRNAAEVAERAGAFAPFFPKVRVRWDETWLYVESNGTDHGMSITLLAKVGIAPYQEFKWQIPLSPDMPSQPRITSSAVKRSPYL